jgi:hypothetical protein
VRLKLGFAITRLEFPSSTVSTRPQNRPLLLTPAALRSHPAGACAMLAVRQLTAALASVAIVFAFSWLTISPGYPHIYAPFSLPVVMSYVVTESQLVAACTIPVFYCAWCWPVLRGASMTPQRSLALLALCLLMSATVIVIGVDEGLMYHGGEYVAGVTAINVVSWAALVWLAALARRKRSWPCNMTFHVALFAWLAWSAFPYLGELP